MDALHQDRKQALGVAAPARALRGRRAFLQGASAEDAVERAYLRRGCVLLGKRVRIGPGEIDLVFRREGLLVFVEVKSSKSHGRAMESLSPKQLNRLTDAAMCYQAAHSELAGMDIRVDLACVDQTGQLLVVPNITL